ncbi:MAG: 2-hydroxychromene-2-carboxylate isomerase [Deltaproteobacteria bacterium]
MPTLEFFYDFVSPYSYLASTRIEAEAARVGATVRYRPFLLGGVFNATGNRAPIDTAAKAAHLATDLGRWARRLGVPFAWPAKFPISTVLAMRTAFAAERARKLVPFTDAMFRAYWAQGRDISDPAVVQDVGNGLGLDGAALVAEAGNHKEALKAQTQEAVDRGSYGAPTFFVGPEMFIGNDRLDFALEALASAGKS